MRSKRFWTAIFVLFGLMLANGALTPIHSVPFQTSSRCYNESDTTHISGDNGRYTFGKKSAIDIEDGNGNYVDVQTCDIKLLVESDDNTVVIHSGVCKYIDIQGKNNKIVLKGNCLLLSVLNDNNTVIAQGTGTIQLLGSHNAVNAATIDSALRPQDVVAQTERPHRGAPRPNRDIHDLHGVLIWGSDNKITIHQGACDTIKISGKGNTVSMSSSCQTLEVTNTGHSNKIKVDALSNLLLRGSLNAIRIDKAGGGEITGNDNSVIYQHGVGRGHITVAERFKVTGQRDTVKRVP